MYFFFLPSSHKVFDLNKKKRRESRFPQVLEIQIVSTVEIGINPFNKQ